MRALNELGIDLYGQTAPTETGAKPSPPDEIDIDAIADMSLPSKRGRR
jgi:hypothetical protein